MATIMRVISDHLRLGFDRGADESTLNAKPVDNLKLSLEEQWLFELIKEEAEKANEAGVNDTPNFGLNSVPRRSRISIRF
jgi:hypothetical protein